MITILAKKCARTFRRHCARDEGVDVHREVQRL
jgi:hypothetical protein